MKNLEFENWHKLIYKSFHVEIQKESETNEGNELFEYFRNESPYFRRSRYFLNEIDTLVLNYCKLTEDKKKTTLPVSETEHGMDWGHIETKNLAPILFEYCTQPIKIKINVDN